MISFKHRSLLGSIVFSIGLWVVAPAHAQTTVLSPSDTIAGVAQSTLSQQWWNWAASHAPADNPINDATGALASQGDRGSHFFLAGYGSTDPVVRRVTVRNDQTLFFPLINVVDGYSDEQMAALGLTAEDIRTETINFFGNASGLFLRLDGTSLTLPGSLANLLAYRQATGKFDLILPSDNIFGGAAAGNPAGVYRAFSDGYWVGLAPFTNGTYELRFGGHEERTGPFAGLTFSQDITYQITVVPEPAILLMMLAGLGLVAGAARRQGRA